MATGTYSIICGVCVLVMFVLYLRMMKGVESSEKRDIYISLMTVGMAYLSLDMVWGALHDELYMRRTILHLQFWHIVGLFMWNICRNLCSTLIR